MTRGRKRKPDPTIPRHIDQAKIPAGIYWRSLGAGKGVWWKYREHAEGGRLQRQPLATETAVLSELHAFAESDQGKARGTVGYVFDKFEQSTEFKALAAGTQRNYKQCAKTLKAYPTKLGIPFGQLHVDRLTVPVIQRLVEAVAQGKKPSAPGAVDGVPGMPTKANHLLRYMRRTFAWGIRFDCCKTNPADGVKQVKERAEFRMPEPKVFTDLLAFARERGARLPHTEGSAPPYLASVMELAYGCRLRGIEVTTLTDANELEVGIQSNRRKGSLDNITKWNPRLRAAWDQLAALRKAAVERTKRPTPMKPEQRILVVSQSGDPLTKSSLDTAWRRLMAMAIKEGVIAIDQRFTLHGLKHRGITDTKGTRAQKKDAAGHKSDASFNVYDHELQVVEPSGDR